MAVVGFREIIPRTYEHKIGGNPTASRLFVATVDAPTASSDVLDAINISHGSQHPEFSGLTCDGYSLDETDRHHVTVTYTYSVQENQGDDPNNNNPPWLQPDVWTFSTNNASVACTEYYPSDAPQGQQNVSHPLVNTAGDAIIGVSKAESELKITISGSREMLNLKDFKKYVNTINSKEWAGFPPHTVQLVGLSGQPDAIEWEGQVARFWRVNIELVYRSSTHNIFIPNVGWNVISDDGTGTRKKQRAWTYIYESGTQEKVPTPHPVALDSLGDFLCGPTQEGPQDYAGNNAGGGGGQHNY